MARPSPAATRQMRYQLLPAKDELFGDLPPPAAPPVAPASGAAAGTKREGGGARGDATSEIHGGGGGGGCVEDGEGEASGVEDGSGSDAEHARKRARRAASDVVDVDSALAKLRRHLLRGPSGGGAFGKAVELLASLMSSHMSRENAPVFLDAVGDAVGADDGSAAGAVVRELLTAAATLAARGVVRGAQLPLLTAWALKVVTAREVRTAEDNFALASAVRVVRASIEGLGAAGSDDVVALRARAATEDGIIACLTAMTARGGAREWARGPTDSTIAAAAVARLAISEANRGRLDGVVSAWRAPRVAHTRMVVHGSQLHPMTRVTVRLDAPEGEARAAAAAEPAGAGGAPVGAVGHAPARTEGHARRMELGQQ